MLEGGEKNKTEFIDLKKKYTTSGQGTTEEQGMQNEDFGQSIRQD